ncbi:MAG: hypothetical protein AAB563_00970 [Patescibacteria group bacterium]
MHTKKLDVPRWVIWLLAGTCFVSIGMMSPDRRPLDLFWAILALISGGTMAILGNIELNQSRSRH